MKWKTSFQSEKSWCHFSLQTEKFGFPNILLYKTIRANSFKNLKSSHKHIFFPRNAFFNPNYSSEEEKTKNRGLCLLPSITLTPLPPCCLSTLHHPPIASLGLWWLCQPRAHPSLHGYSHHQCLSRQLYFHQILAYSTMCQEVASMFSRGKVALGYVGSAWIN